MAEKKTYLHLNGKAIGYIEEPAKFVSEVRQARRKGQISGEVNIVYFEKNGEIHINTDRGRLRKPYIIVENGKSKMTDELNEKLRRKEINFNYLLRSGIIEYLDAEEEENAYVALSEKEINPDTTHLEANYTSVFGLTINTSPFPEHNALAYEFCGLLNVAYRLAVQMKVCFLFCHATTIKVFLSCLCSLSPSPSSPRPRLRLPWTLAQDTW